MGVQFSTTLRNAEMTAIATAMGAGGTIDVRTGAAPGVGNSDTGTLLATCTGVTFGSSSSGAVVFSSTADSSADATGTPGHIRMKTSGGTAVAEIDAAVGSGTANFAAGVSLGGTVTQTSGTFTCGNA